jgi:hypothetical protein
VLLRSHDSPIYLLPSARIRGGGGDYLPWQGASLESLEIAETFNAFFEGIISRLEEAVRGLDSCTDWA